MEHAPFNMYEPLMKFITLLERMVFDIIVLPFHWLVHHHYNDIPLKGRKFDKLMPSFESLEQ